MSKLDELRRAAADASDVLRRARGLREIARAVAPAALVSVRVLNEGGGERAPAAEVVRALRALRNRLKSEALDAQGRVDYAALRGSATYDALEEASRMLHGVGPEDLGTDAERTAFFVNLYNVLSIHGVIALGIEESVMEVPSFFRTVAYRLGAGTLTLDQIENGVLRRNGRHPATRARSFRDGDPRLAYAPSVVDARIHAALVCASKSCPPVGFYDPDRLDDQLDLAAAGYVASEVEVDDAGRRLILPITFRYYAEDFGDHGAFLLRHAEGEQRRAIERALARGYAVDHPRYDWSLNARAVV